MKISKLMLDGCFLVDLGVVSDKRGSFTKTFHRPSLEGTPLFEFNVAEEFYTVSNINVLRGLHFQTPPAAHDKLVSCLNGEVLDFFLDIRPGSPTFGMHQTIHLKGERPQLVFLPIGIAHGFLSLTNQAAMLYKTNNEYSPENDAGILWSSIGLDLGVAEKDIVISDRDRAFPEFKSYRSPF